jgi:DNA-binding XRE family transcriptional regulator
MKFITPEQCRMARALNEWSRNDLAERAGVHPHTVAAVERGAEAEARTLSKIVIAFELAGVTFTPDGGVRPGRDWLQIIEGPEANAQLLEDIYQRLKDKGGEVLLAGLSEYGPEEPEKLAFLKAHLQRLQEAGITERIILRNGDYNLVAPRDWYRWHDTSDLGDTPFQLYGERIALIEWGPPERIILIDHPKFAATFRNLFNTVWDVSTPVPETIDA